MTSPEALAKGFHARAVVRADDRRRRGHPEEREEPAGDDSRGNVALEFYDARNRRERNALSGRTREAPFSPSRVSLYLLLRVEVARARERDDRLCGF